MSEAKQPKIIGQILDLKSKYFKLKESIDDSAMQFPQLIQIRKDMACLSLELAVQASKYARDFKSSKAAYEIARFLKQRELMAKGVKVTAADAQAKQEVIEMLEQVAIDEGLYQTGRLILAQTNEILKSLNQDISIIKKEYEQIANT